MPKKSMEILTETMFYVLMALNAGDIGEAIENFETARLQDGEEKLEQLRLQVENTYDAFVQCAEKLSDDDKIVVGLS